MINNKTLNEVVLKPITGEWGSEGDNVNVLRTTNFTNEGKLNYSKVVKRNIDPIKVEKKKLKVGDIIIEKSGGSPKQPVGRVVFFENEGEYLCNNFTAILRPKKDEIVPKYLFYILFCNHKFGFTSAYQNKTTGIINLQLPRYLKGTEVSLPPLDQQKKIAAILDAADRYRQKTKALISKYDELTQSLFLDMFGDPVKNKFNWSPRKCGDFIEYLADIGSNGANKVISEKLVMSDDEDYAIMIRTTNLNRNDFVNNIKYVSKDVYEFFKKSQIFGGEIIMNKIGSAGDFWIMPNLEKPVSLGLNQFVIRLKDINLQFFYHFLSTDYGTLNIKSRCNGAATKSITKTAVRDLPILYPPIELQNKFAERVQAIEVQKAQTEASLVQADNLFNSLLQKAFKGELI